MNKKWYIFIRYINLPIEFTNNKDNKYFNINSKYKYILTIIDHFSRFSDSYLLTDKKQTTILEKIKNFFEFYGEPNEFQTDNGREFVNRTIINYLNS